jgi:dTMP kinase
VSGSTRDPDPTARFLSFEGIEGSGKTTQAQLLAGWLRSRGRDVLLVREPGGTDRGERIRSLLLDPVGPPMDAWCELCLYMAARAQLVQEVVRPALARGAVVIADRFGEASIAYQGGGRGLGGMRVRALYRWVTLGLRPGRVYLLDLRADVGLRRIRESRGPAALDRLESEPLSFHRRVRSAYRRMARREPERFRLLDALRPVDDLQRDIREDLRLPV